jgi:hypothetical protein
MLHPASRLLTDRTVGRNREFEPEEPFGVLLDTCVGHKLAFHTLYPEFDHVAVTPFRGRPMRWR